MKITITNDRACEEITELAPGKAVVDKIGDLWIGTQTGMVCLVPSGTSRAYAGAFQRDNNKLERQYAPYRPVKIKEIIVELT